MSDSPGRRAIVQARTLRRKGDLAGAYKVLQEARQADPLDSALWYEQAKLFVLGKQYEVAEKQLAMYVAFHSGSPIPFLRLADVQYRLGRIEDAIATHRANVARHGEYAPALSGLAFLVFQLGLVDEGNEYLRRTVAAAPIDAESVTAIGLANLILGELTAGFAGLSKHWDMFDREDLPPWRLDATRLWTGDALNGRPLVVHGEHGLGDVILALRFVPQLERFGGPVYVDVPPPLRRLARQLAGVSVIDDVMVEPADALHTGVSFVPAALGIRSTVDVLSAMVPYFHGETTPAGGDQSGALKVGIVWRGAPGITQDADRSVPHFSDLAPLFAVPGIEWQSLQFGDYEADINVEGVRRLGEVRDMFDTASVIDQLDLVIAVDTSVANLAGAMGKPVWIMIPTAPEYRWGFDQSTTPWYPSARLFRRKHTNDWPIVIAEVRDALEAEMRRR